MEGKNEISRRLWLTGTPGGHALLFMPKRENRRKRDMPSSSHRHGREPCCVVIM